MTKIPSVDERLGAVAEREVSPCVFCGTRSATWFTRRTGPWGVVVCSECGIGSTVPQPSAEETRVLYEGDYADESARKFVGLLETGRRLFVRRLAMRIARFAGPGGRVLDIGCGDGKLLVELARRGYTCAGTDLNPHVGDTAPADSSTEVHVGDVESARLPSAAFRVVVVRHVLEHLSNPLATLREIRRVIQDDGVLMVAVPNLQSWQASVLRDRWFHLDLPRHLFHFTPQTISAALANSGFRVDRLSHFSLEQNPYGWLQGISTVAGGRWRHLYDQLRAPGSAHAQPRDPVVTVVAAALAPICVLVATLESSLRRGGTIEVWARPN